MGEYQEIAIETTFENLAAEMDACNASPGWAHRVRELGQQTVEFQKAGAITTDDLRSHLHAARKIITKAQEILAEHLPSDGPSAYKTIVELLGLLDGPEARAALCDGGRNV